MDVPEVPGALLLCVDMQAGFLRALPDQERVTRRCQFALAAARGLGLRRLFSEQVPHKLGPTLPELVAIAPDAPRCAKSSFSALANEAISTLLQNGAIEHLLLCGIETPICVYQTAIDALNANLQVTVLSDAIGARRADDAAAALAALARAGVHVLPAETVLYSILHDASHPFFKEFTSLVKTHG